MNFLEVQATPLVLWAGNGLMAALLALSLWATPWRQLQPATLAAWLAGSIAMAGMWLVAAGVQPGLSFHLLGAAIFTLMCGPFLAMLLMALVLLFVAVAGQLDGVAIGLNFSLSVLPAIWLTAASLRLARRYLPPHLFVYVFVNAFLTGGLSMLVAASCGMLWLYVAGVYPADYLLENGLPFYFLLSWSEAFTTGLVLAIMVVYRPQWVWTFDDRRYLAEDKEF